MRALGRFTDPLLNAQVALFLESTLWALLCPERWATERGTGSFLTEIYVHIKAPRAFWASIPEDNGSFTIASDTFLIRPRDTRKNYKTLLNHKLEQMGFTAYL